MKAVIRQAYPNRFAVNVNIWKVVLIHRVRIGVDIHRFHHFVKHT